MYIKAVSIGRPQLISNQYGQTFKSGIRKKPVQSAFLRFGGFELDGVADLRNHGGDDRAVCFYPFEHYQGWEERTGKSLSIPSFGENLTVTNMLEYNVCIGDVYEVGDTVLQITQGRIPCITIDQSNGIKGMLNEIIRTGKTGFFAKVLLEGEIKPDLELILQERPNPGLNILDLHRLFFHDRENYEEILRVIAVPELANDMRNKFEKLLASKRL
ncbi:MOSC domain-containing protein [Lederbergia wuyishanensis]|uniref:MOSC domain-containing protein YiiM n=1 Tax=Lederbergia wuyishanensis TaxID=1347903 RepID=A0ABU0D0N4_9BACI|nr:MOSC domain-containing protein [Lederbergia wuyishanensis]MCJ8006578.1 MOSC domain-containing protein [Lederbergia wuyishanensis]MDQ0341959.1 MOSC domain-containing protein YiiM [Lederbergia wuyishanensis]